MRAATESPFLIIRRDGMVHIERGADEVFRRALMAGVPPSVRPKMREALAAIPDKGSMAHSVRYFGGPEKIAELKNKIAPLMIELNQFLVSQNIHGLYDWLDITGFGSEYRMIKAFDAWADLAKTPSSRIILP